MSEQLFRQCHVWTALCVWGGLNCSSDKWLSIQLFIQPLLRTALTEWTIEVPLSPTLTLVWILMTQNLVFKYNQHPHVVGGPVMGKICSHSQQIKPTRSGFKLHCQTVKTKWNNENDGMVHNTSLSLLDQLDEIVSTYIMLVFTVKIHRVIERPPPPLYNW